MTVMVVIHCDWITSVNETNTKIVYTSNKLSHYLPSNMNVSTSFLISVKDIPSPFSSLAVNKISRKSRYFLPMRTSEDVF